MVLEAGRSGIEGLPLLRVALLCAFLRQSGVCVLGEGEHGTVRVRLTCVTNSVARH